MSWEGYEIIGIPSVLVDEWTMPSQPKKAKTVLSIVKGDYTFKIIRTTTPTGKTVRWLAQKWHDLTPTEEIITATQKDAQHYLNFLLRMHCELSVSGIHLFEPPKKLSVIEKMIDEATGYKEKETCIYCGQEKEIK